MEDLLNNRPFYNLKSILGYNWATFYILLGGAQAGKSYSVMDFCLDQKAKKGDDVKFYWFRLKPAQTKKLLRNNAQDFIDPDLLRKYNLELRTVGQTVYSTKYKKKVIKKKNGTEDFEIREDKSKRKVLCTVNDLSTFYNDKGVGYFDKDYTGWYNIVVDEFQPEKGERRTFDIVNGFVRAMENLVRNSKFKVRIFLMANLLEDASDLLASFNFLPEAFGRYSLVKNKKILVEYMKEYTEALKQPDKDKLLRQLENKYCNVDFGFRAIIDYIEPSDAYKKMRTGSIADRMLRDNSEYSNEIQVDKSLIYKGKLHKPSYIIKFTKDKKDWFVVWDSNVVRKYNNESVKAVVAMTPGLDAIFEPKARDNIFTIFDSRSYLYKDLITFKLFQNRLLMLKPRGY